MSNAANAEGGAQGGPSDAEQNTNDEVTDVDFEEVKEK
jgi:hypothetical protein